MDNQQKTLQKPKNNNPKNQPMLLRSLALVVAFILAGGGLSLRLSQLQIDQAAEWEARASRQQLANVDIVPKRGNIYDANMKLLAQSATVWTVTSSPEALNQSVLRNTEAKDPAQFAATELSRILELDQAELLEKFSDKKKMYYKVKSKIEKPLADEIRALCDEYGLRGIYLTEDTKRYYPYETMASTVLGFVGEDNVGLEGIERWYDETLAGTPGRTVMVKDAWGREIATNNESTVYPAENGRNLVLTLDSEIQRAVERQLEAAVVKNNARQRGFCIVMDVNTGAILALAVYPSYNPNKPYDILDPRALEELALLPEGSDEYIELQGQARTLQWRNKALADTYEPGSVLKVITAAAALDSGIYHQDDKFACGGTYYLQEGQKPFSCAGDPPTNHGYPTLREALIESCNISFIHMSAGMGKDVWYNYIKAFGLTEPTGVDLPGEPSKKSMQNLVYSEDRMGPFELASVSFGQSNKYTAVQMIAAISASVNGGNLMQPYIVDREVDDSGNVIKQYSPVIKRQVISPDTSAQICDILEELVTDTPNGRHAYVAGYRVGGKSGTSEKLEIMVQENRNDAFISSFVGFAPADNPDVAVLMMLDEPEDTTMGNYFGGRMVGPYVGEVLRECLDIRGFEPSYGTESERARTTVSTPKVTETDLARARVELNNKNLTYHVVGNGDTVIGQMPAPHTDIPYGGEVVLYTEAGVSQEMVTVPDLSMRSPQPAVELLRGLGINVLTTGAPDDGQGVLVTGQSIEAHTTVPRGTVIVLTLEDQRKVDD